MKKVLTSITLFGMLSIGSIILAQDNEITTHVEISNTANIAIGKNASSQLKVGVYDSQDNNRRNVSVKINNLTVKALGDNAEVCVEVPGKKIKVNCNP